MTGAPGPQTQGDPKTQEEQTKYKTLEGVARTESLQPSEDTIFLSSVHSCCSRDTVNSNNTVHGLTLPLSRLRLIE